MEEVAWCFLGDSFSVTVVGDLMEKGLIKDCLGI